MLTYNPFQKYFNIKIFKNNNLNLVTGVNLTKNKKAEGTTREEEKKRNIMFFLPYQVI